MRTAPRDLLRNGYRVNDQPPGVEQLRERLGQQTAGPAQNS